jgi:hypothetical protein
MTPVPGTLTDFWLGLPSVSSSITLVLHTARDAPIQEGNAQPIACLFPKMAWRLSHRHSLASGPTSDDELPSSAIKVDEICILNYSAPHIMAEDIYSELRPERQEIRLMFLEAGEPKEELKGSPHGHQPALGCRVLDPRVRSTLIRLGRSSDHSSDQTE